MKVLVLGGGHYKGAYQAGALPVVFDHYNPNLIIGTSVGALNGAFIVDRIGRGLSYDLAAQELAGFWRGNITGFDAIATRRSWFNLFINGVFSRWQGLVNMDKLRTLVRDNIKAKNLQVAFEKYNVRFVCTTVDVDSGDVILFDGTSCDIVDAVLASASVPGEMSPVVAGGVELFDGGLRDPIPIKSAYRYVSDFTDKEIDEILAIAIYPREIGMMRETDTSNLLQLVNRSFEVSLGELHARSLSDAIRASDEGTYKADLQIIQPYSFLDTRFGCDFLNFDSGHILGMMQAGHNDATEHFFGTF